MASKRKAASTKSKSISADKKDTTKTAMKEDIISIFLFMLAVFLFICVQNFQGKPEDTQFIGLLGSYFMKGLQALFGSAAYVASFFLLAWSIHVGMNKKLWSTRMWGFALLAITFLVSKSVYDTPNGISTWEAGLNGMGGGYIGGALALTMVKLVGRLGSNIFLFLFFILSLVMIMQKPLSQIAAGIWKITKKARQSLSDIMYYEEELVHHTPPANEPVIINPNQETTPEKPLISMPRKKDPALEKEADLGTDMEIMDARTTDGKNKTAPKDSEYVKPPVELLSNLGSERSIDKKNIRESIAILEDTFTSFGIGVKVNQVSCGPAVTRYELTPAPGVKVSKIISLTDDLQLNLAAPGIRMRLRFPANQP
jgi:S-DNA-T family DNA segregation ATPase FtsK/SpoIIIE